MELRLVVNTFKDEFWWPIMRQDIKSEQQKYVKCARFDVVAEGFHSSKSITADQPWDHLEIDLIGPLPTSKKGYNYILTIVDVCTAYTVLQPLENKNIECCKKALGSFHRLWNPKNNAIR